MPDWSLNPRYEVGRQGDFYWIRYHYFIDPLKYIELPGNKYRALLLEFDSGAPGQYFGTNPGWSELGEFAISDAANELPNLCYNADMAYLLLDKEFDQSLLGQFENFDFSYEESNEKFWAMLSSVKPFCYSSFGNGTFFASQSKDAVELLHSNKLLKLVEKQEREVERKGRLGTWQSLGPECGPEKCIEFDCERLRIQLAVRCFLHQMHSR